MNMDAILKDVAQRGKMSEHHYVPLGYLGILSFILYYFIWHSTQPVDYENLPLRVFGGILSVILVAKRYWPNRFQPFLPFYWYLYLLFAPAFFISFMTFHNPHSNVWPVSLMSGVFLSMLLVDWLSFTVLWLIGLSISWTCYILTTDIVVLPHRMLHTLPAYFMIVIAGVLFIRKTDSIQKERLLSMKTLANTIAHELRTPLVGIGVGASGLLKYLPRLVAGFSVAQKNHLVSERIKTNQLEALTQLASNIQSQARYASLFIDMTLINVKTGNINKDTFRPCTMLQAINEALQQYPFQEGERELITVDIKQESDDFTYVGDELLTIHIFFNLIKNALYYIKAANKGHITIQASIGKKTNRIIFEDTGQGMNKKTLSRVFDRFYSESDNGTGIGLSFCQMIMQAYNGNITCTSAKGKYTRFTLYFPVIKADPK